MNLRLRARAVSILLEKWFCCESIAVELVKASQALLRISKRGLIAVVTVRQKVNVLTVGALVSALVGWRLLRDSAGRDRVLVWTKIVGFGLMLSSVGVLCVVLVEVINEGVILDLVILVRQCFSLHVGVLEVPRHEVI